MLILLSPSKTLDYERKLSSKTTTMPQFLPQTVKLAAQLKKLQATDIKELMHVSDNIAILNYHRFQNFNEKFGSDNSAPAIFAFKGDVYDNMDVKNYNQSDLDFAQNHVRILSGFYGLLRPLDLMQPYRLEMGTQFKNSGGKNLYEFWGSKLTESINNDEKEVVVNLASNEYFKAINTKNLNTKLVTIVFKQLKNGKLSTIGLMAKRARGMMTDYIIKNRIKNVNELTKFNSSGYIFQKNMSDENTLTFILDMEA